MIGSTSIYKDKIMSRIAPFVSSLFIVACQSDVMVHSQDKSSPTEASTPDNDSDDEPSEGMDGGADQGDGEADEVNGAWAMSGDTVEIGLSEPPFEEEPVEEEPIVLNEGMVEVELAPALFVMGIDPDDEDFDAAHWPHIVELTHEWAISETEVTFAQFEHYMGYNPAEVWGFDGPGFCDDCPVAEISWSEAQAFGNAMSVAHGLEACFTCTGEGTEVACEPAKSPYECNGFRLPTEAEWEHAARGGEDFSYPGGDDIDAVAYWEENSGGQAYPVGSKAPNGFGLYDMGGNIRERVYDAFYPYSGDDLIDPVVDIEYTGDLYAERGGSWACRRPEIRWNRRNLVWDYARDIHTGFRVARIL
jgi:formylglycine-generating enzyme required for sulfatase activity